MTTPTCTSDFCVDRARRAVFARSRASATAVRTECFVRCERCAEALMNVLAGHPAVHEAGSFPLPEADGSIRAGDLVIPAETVPKEVSR